MAEARWFAEKYHPHAIKQPKRLNHVNLIKNATNLRGGAEKMKQERIRKRRMKSVESERKSSKERRKNKLKKGND